MARTQQQREAELQSRKAAALESIRKAQITLEATEQTLKDTFYPSEKKFKSWAIAMRAVTPDRAINAKEFLKDFFKELVTAMDQHKDLLTLGEKIIDEWEQWFNGIDQEDLMNLEAQIDALSLPLSSMAEIH